MPRAVLGVRRLRGALRGLRDGQRQLVAAGHDERARCVDDRGRSCADGVLGDGDDRACLLRGRPARRAAQADATTCCRSCSRGRSCSSLSCPTTSRCSASLAFGLAGLGCSALLPLTISFGQEELTAVSAAAAGGVIAFYQLGYGIAAFGVGPLAGRRRRAVHRLRGGGGRRGGDGALVLRRRGREPTPSTTHTASGLGVPTSLRRAVRDHVRRPAGGRVEVGGGLRTYSVDGEDVVDGYGVDEMATGGRGQVLIPWPNRIQDGSYEFEGRRHQLPLTEPEHSNAIHGLVRWGAWHAREREPHRVVLGHVLHRAARLSVLAGARDRVRAIGRAASRYGRRRPTSGLRPVRTEVGRTRI